MEELILLMVIGRSRTGKSTLVDGIVSKLDLNDVRVFLADKETRKKFYKDASFCRRSTIEKGIGIKSYQDSHIGDTFVIEDITTNLNGSIIETLRHLLTVRRTNTILITQNMRGMESFVREVRYVIFFETGDLTNLKTILRGGNYSLLSEEIRNLDVRKYIIVDTLDQTYCGPYKNVEISPIIDALNDKMNSKSYRKTLKKKERIKKEEPKNRQVTKLLLENQSLKYAEIGKIVGIRSSHVGKIIYEAREIGLLPNKEKGTWTKEDIEECLKKLK